MPQFLARYFSILTNLLHFLPLQLVPYLMQVSWLAILPRRRLLIGLTMAAPLACPRIQWWVRTSFAPVSLLACSFGTGT